MGLLEVRLLFELLKLGCFFFKFCVFGSDVIVVKLVCRVVVVFWCC